MNLLYIWMEPERKLRSNEEQPQGWNFGGPFLFRLFGRGESIVELEAEENSQFIPGLFSNPDSMPLTKHEYSVLSDIWHPRII